MDNIKALGIICIILFVASSIVCIGDLSEDIAGSIVLLIINCIGIGMCIEMGWSNEHV